MGRRCRSEEELLCRCRAGYPFRYGALWLCHYGAGAEGVFRGHPFHCVVACLYRYVVYWRCYYAVP
ncbi:hypothetical protein GCM10027085_05840 [Spirosoma aerophilum]